MLLAIRDWDFLCSSPIPQNLMWSGEQRRNYPLADAIHKSKGWDHTWDWLVGVRLGSGGGGGQQLAGTLCHGHSSWPPTCLLAIYSSHSSSPVSSFSCKITQFAGILPYNCVFWLIFISRTSSALVMAVHHDVLLGLITFPRKRFFMTARLMTRSGYLQSYYVIFLTGLIILRESSISVIALYL